MGMASGGVTTAQITAATTPKGSYLDFWSAALATIDVAAGIADFNLSNVVIPAIAGLTAVKAYVLVAVDTVNEAHGVDNGLDTTSYIQVNESAAGWVTGATFLTNCILLTANTKQQKPINVVGDADVSSRCALDKTINFRWHDLSSNSGDVDFYGVRTGVRLVF